jgi:coproporphyrinogen III oxidase-like Fe-S oxidoreductase
VETLDRDVQARERLMLGLRLDDPLPLERVAAAVDEQALGRLVGLGLVRRVRSGGAPALALTPRGRLLGGGVTAELLA